MDSGKLHVLYHEIDVVPEMTKEQKSNGTETAGSFYTFSLHDQYVVVLSRCPMRERVHCTTGRIRFGFPLQRIVSGNAHSVTERGVGISTPLRRVAPLPSALCEYWRTSFSARFYSY